MELQQIIKEIETWQTVYDYGQPPTATRIETALGVEPVLLRKADGLTVKAKAANLHVQTLDDDRVSLVIYYDGTRNGQTSTASLEFIFSYGSWGHVYGRRGSLPSVYKNGSGFATFPQGAIDLIHTHYETVLAGLVESGVLDGATALVEALEQERKSRIYRGLHQARMALEDVSRGVTR